VADKNPKCAEAQLIIRKPVSEVFEAFINPAVTKNFWFTKSTGKLEVNRKVTWEWEMYGASADVVPKEIIQDKKIVYDWGDPSRTVEFTFRQLDDISTFVTVKECGFNQTGDDLIEAIKGSTGGFTTVLDGLKAYLEHGINLNLIADKFLKN
jgi:uncharacterized protein YndB with AHSA1/START domain